MNLLFQKKSTKNILLILLLIILSAFIGALVGSSSTSPLFIDVFGTDSAMFQTIGKLWSEGMIPYQDTFDSKGPVIFFINMLGYLITNSGTGVFIVQIIFISAAEYIIFFYLSKKMPASKALIYALLYPILLMLQWQGGNYTEEYILPFLFISFFLINEWEENAERKKYDHNPVHAGIYGIAFAVALLTRVTNALGICVCVLLVCIVLLIKKKWKNLLLNAAGFILGTLTLVLPFSIYFAVNNTFDGFLFGTVLYNVKYAINSFTQISTTISLILRIVLIISFGCYLICACIFLLFERSHRLRAIFWLIPAIIQTIFSATLRTYAHYGLVMVPFFFIAIMITSDARISVRKLRKIVEVLVLAAGIGMNAYAAYYVTRPNDETETAKWINSVDSIYDFHNDNFIAYDVSGGFYLVTDITPCYKYCFMQDWAASQNDQYEEDMIETYNSLQADWILIYDDGTESLIDSILSKNYTEETRHNNYILYKKSSN